MPGQPVPDPFRDSKPCALARLLGACLLAWAVLGGQAQAARKADPRQKQLEEEHRQCVQACPKPVYRQGEEEAVWREHVRAESHYDHCVLMCDRALLKEMRK